MACRELIKITSTDDSVQPLIKVLTRLDSRQWKRAKDDEEFLMNVISTQVYLPEEGKALTDEDKTHLQAVRKCINDLANNNIFENIKGDDLNKLLKIFELPTAS